MVEAIATAEGKSTSTAREPAPPLVRNTDTERVPPMITPAVQPQQVRKTKKVKKPDISAAAAAESMRITVSKRSLERVCQPFRVALALEKGWQIKMIFPHHQNSPPFMAVAENFNPKTEDKP